MSEAKIRLSPAEKEMVMDAELILTKNRILSKAELLLGSLQEKQAQFNKTILARFPAEVFSIPPKISKGENYLGLPYRVLDHPRIFGQPDVFAVRTLFWWGNFFSCTLHLAGNYLAHSSEKITRAFPLLAAGGYFYGTGGDPWQHHFERDNYVPVHSFSPAEFEKAVGEKDFIKLSQKIALQDWEEAEEKLLTYYRELLEITAA